MEANGFPGKRVDAYLAGMIPTNFSLFLVHYRFTDGKISEKKSKRDGANPVSIHYNIKLNPFLEIKSKSEQCSTVFDWSVTGLIIVIFCKCIDIL